MTNKDDIRRIWVTDEEIRIALQDGEERYERITDYERLRKASQSQLSSYKVSRFGIHWPELDEDLSFNDFKRVNP